MLYGHPHWGASEGVKNMLNPKKIILTLITFFLALTLLSGEEIEAIPSDYSKFNVLSYRSDAAGKELKCPVDGKIIKEKKSGDKTTILISCVHSYYWKGKKETCNYELIIYNIKNYIKSSEVKYGNTIGVIENDTALLGRCNKADPYLILGSAFPALFYKKNYYFQPGWLNQTTDTLSYRQVTSFEECVNDYYSRWKSELEENDNEQRYNSLFNYPDLDSISFKIKLEKYPVSLNNKGSLGITSMSYFGRNIWETFTLIDSKCEYTPVLCWQYNFKSYLESEYQLGTDLYIYGKFLALDHVEKRIIFNVRDFLIQSEEEKYEERLKDIKNIK